MIKNLLIMALVSLSVLTANTSRAVEFDQAKVMQIIAENKDMSTELKGANILIAYADLMGYLSGDLIASSDASVRNLLPQVEDHINRHDRTSDPELRNALVLLKSKVVELATGTSQTNTAVQNMSNNINAMKNLTLRFPNAKFTATLELMIGLTQEFAVNYSNYTAGIAKYATTLGEDQRAAKMLRALGEQREQITKYSFSEIGERFAQISAVIRMMYGQ